MDKETISHYGWIVAVLIAAMAFMLMATPLSTFLQNNMQQMSLKYILQSHMTENELEPDLEPTDTITITYDLNGSDVYWSETNTGSDMTNLQHNKIKKLVVNTTNSLPMNLTREGHELQGWSKTGSEPALTQWKAVAGQDVTLKPVWIKKKYPVYFQTNGGYFQNASSNIVCTVSDNSKTITVQTPVREGYSFQGWYYDEALKEKAVGATANSQQTFTLSTPNIKAEITLYAKWKKK